MTKERVNNNAQLLAFLAPAISATITDATSDQSSTTSASGVSSGTSITTITPSELTELVCRPASK